MAVTGDAGPLCTGPVGSTGRRRLRPLRSRIKPGSTTPPSSRRRGVDLAGNDGTLSSTSGGSGWVSCARRSSWGLVDLVGNVVGRGAPWGHVQSAAGPCIGVSPYSGLYVISPKKSAATVARIRSLPRPRHAMDNSSTTFDNISLANGLMWHRRLDDLGVPLPSIHDSGER